MPSSKSATVTAPSPFTSPTYLDVHPKSLNKRRMSPVTMKLFKLYFQSNITNMKLQFATLSRLFLSFILIYSLSICTNISLGQSNCENMSVGCAESGTQQISPEEVCCYTNSLCWRLKQKSPHLSGCKESIL